MVRPTEYYIGQFVTYKPGKLVTLDVPTHFRQTREEKQARAVANQFIKKQMEQ